VSSGRSPLLRRFSLATSASIAIGFVLCVVGAAVNARRTAAAYLVAYVACLAVVLGALAMIGIARATAATWFIVLRRQAEQVVATLPAFGVLFIPVLVAARLLYPWARQESSPELLAAIAGKSAYLNLPFFIVRAAIYWIVWIGLGEVLRQASVRQDRGDSPELERRLRIASAGGLVAFAITVTFASIDWMMSLAPTWYSTIYGVDYFAGGMVGALALLATLIARGRRHGELPDTVGVEHLHALAKLLLTFVLFWVYIGFSQFIVIWSAEIPAESSWYVIRARGGWGALGALLVAGHFALPFCALLIRAIKRNIWAMAAIGVWMLVMHYADIYWMVMPDVTGSPAGAAHGWWIDLGALLLVAGIGSATWTIRRAGEAAIPRGDPGLVASLDYSTN
jgi:hypothetical protein